MIISFGWARARQAGLPCVRYLRINQRVSQEQKRSADVSRNLSSPKKLSENLAFPRGLKIAVTDTSM